LGEWVKKRNYNEERTSNCSKSQNSWANLHEKNLEKRIEIVCEDCKIRRYKNGRHDLRKSLIFYKEKFWPKRNEVKKSFISRTSIERSWLSIKIEQIRKRQPVDNGCSWLNDNDMKEREAYEANGIPHTDLRVLKTCVDGFCEAFFYPLKDSFIEGLEKLWTIERKRKMLKFLDFIRKVAILMTDLLLRMIKLVWEVH
jgi:hypothetical protein